MKKTLFQNVWCTTCNWYVILFYGLCKCSSPIIINLHFLGKIAKISASIKQVYYSFFFDIDIVNTWWETTFWKKVNDDNNMLIQIETVFVKYIHHEACLCQVEIWRWFYAQGFCSFTWNLNRLFAFKELCKYFANDLNLS